MTNLISSDIFIDPIFRSASCKHQRKIGRGNEYLIEVYQQLILSFLPQRMLNKSAQNSFALKGNVRKVLTESGGSKVLDMILDV